MYFFNLILTTGGISVILVLLSQKGKLRYKKGDVPRLTQLGEVELGQKHWNTLSHPLTHTQQSLQAHY